MQDLNGLGDKIAQWFLYFSAAHVEHNADLQFCCSVNQCGAVDWKPKALPGTGMGDLL